VQDFRNLRAWHLAREFALAVIEALPDRSARRVPGLRNQAIRAVNSVHATLAEGCAKATRLEFLHYIEMSVASLNEVESHLQFARDSAVLKEELHTALQVKAVLLRRMLVSLMRALQRRIAEEESRRRGDHDGEPRMILRESTSRSPSRS
jgi:four helix bundle protein